MRILAASAEERPELLPDSGTIRLADNVRIISFDQKREQLDQSQTLRRALAPEGDSVVIEKSSVKDLDNSTQIGRASCRERV